MENATRSGSGSRSTSARNGPATGGAQYGSPTAGPAVASRSAALSRTDRVTACSATRPDIRSPADGASEFLALVGFRPNTPQHDAGILIDPPPSFAWAAGSIPAATAAADPPLEPPGERVVSQGLWVAP